jgi:hypothetical protein
MYVDNELVLSDAQALSVTGAVATNTIDLGVARSIGNGEPMAVVFSVDVAADQTTGDEDYTFDIEYSSTADQSAGYVLMGRRVFESGTPAAPAQDADLLVAGYRFAIPIPPTGAGDDERYFGARYTLAGTTPTITVTAYVTPMSMLDATVDYADGFTIS